MNQNQIENHNKRFIRRPYHVGSDGLSTIKGLKFKTISKEQYFMLAMMMLPYALLPIADGFHNNQPIQLATTNHPESTGFHLQTPSGIMAEIGQMPVFEEISSQMVDLYNKQIDPKLHIAPSHPKVNAAMAKAVGLNPKEIKGRGRSEWSDKYFQTLENNGIKLSGFEKVTATGLFAFGVVIEEGGKLFKYGWDKVGKKVVRMEITNKSQLLSVVKNVLTNTVSGEGWDNVNQSTIDKSPSAEATAQAVAVEKLKNPENFQIIALSSVAAIPLNPGQVILSEEAIRAGATVLLDSVGNVIGLAVPLTAIGTLLVNPAIVQDMIEGPPKILINNQWYQLTIDQATLLRLGQPIDINGQIINPNGQVIARIQTVSTAQDNNSSQLSNTSNSPEITPQATQLSSSDQKIFDYEQYKKDHPNVARVLEELGLDNRYFLKGVVRDKADEKFEIPYIDLSKAENQEETVNSLIEAARADGVRLILNVGPSTSGQPAEIAINNPNVLVIAIDKNNSPIQGYAVFERSPKSSTLSSLAVFWKKDLFDLKPEYNFDEIYIIAPAPYEQDQFNLIAQSVKLLSSGGKIKIFFDPSTFTNLNKLKSIFSSDPNLTVLENIINPDQIYESYGITSQYLLESNTIGSMLTIIKK